MKAAGTTLTDSELLAELTGSVMTGYAAGHRPVYVADGPDDGESFEVREVVVTGTAITICVDRGSVVTPEDACTDLLRRYLAKELTAAQLRKLAAEEIEL